MDFKGSVILFLVFIAVYSIIIEIFTVLFRLTGLTKEKAKTQVISMLTNSGFTTSESEIIMQSGKRRKLSRLTMLFGYSFTVIIVSVVVNIFFTLSRTEVKSMTASVIAAVAFLVLLFIFFRIRAVADRFDIIIEKIGNKIMFGKKSNVIVLIDNYNGRAMAEIFLEFIPSFLHGIPLAESRLKETYDIQIMLLKRKGENAGLADGGTVLCSGDIVVVFGSYKNIRMLFEQPDEVLT